MNHTLPRTMRAWRQERYGGPDVMRLDTVDVPTPRRGEVLVRVRAASLNSGDVRVMRGEPLVVRAAFGVRRPRQQVRGMDAAATVVALGEGVDDLAVGDEVFGELPGGALAEYAIAPARRVIRRPDALAPEVAAALPVAGGTALQAVDRAGVAPGARVLVIGASGGVGTSTVQLCAHRGADVWALCGERNRALVESLGASKTFNYRAVQPGAPELGEASFDAVFDIAGTAPLTALRRLVRDGGRVVLVAGEGNRVFGPLGRLAAASLISLGSRRKLVPLAAAPSRELLTRLADLALEGALAPVIEREWTLGEAGAAIAHVDAGHTAGKVLVRRE
ncbi:NAD(P)-dependent alcohol dehydrogenase [Microbacterium sp. C7(2022)]|uniref:NAD(P)-dependent alcohol dehydrogenase n=1 Tax=Microbacterium sp. C7(2022) TaxID=2992759 RepID=UPI00237B122C|nr:NAD(P)-dependent alcohol dehydrogenase [Microbacterium sp. C7(2022)]MDE0546601.1 NAD(P)-dependent alcohol dehydrogenase [Microbacterium sp. C7(2022)]